MASSLHKVGTIQDLAPGESVTKHWNNATPANAVWHVQAVPQKSGFTSNEPKEQHVQAEVTRVWRVLRRTAGTKEFEDEFFFEHEVWYEVKNTGTRAVDCDVYAGVVSGS